MNDRPTTLERAFQLARSGSITSLTELALALRAEGYSDAKAQLTSRSLKLQLRQIWTAASRAAPADVVKLD